MWELLRYFKREGDLKVILKDNYKHYPIIGWGIRGFQFIMLARNWAKDRKGLRQQLDVFKKDGFPLRLLIFPEGTTANTRDIAKSEKYAAANGKPTYELLVVPRTTGFLACVEALTSPIDRNDGGGGGGNGGANAGGNGKPVAASAAFATMPVVYDVTMAYEGYSGEIPTWEMGYGRAKDVALPSLGKLLAGAPQRPVHLHIVRHPMVAAAADGEAFVLRSWAKKEQLLQGFVKEGKFPGEPQRVLKPRPAVASFLLAMALPLLAGEAVR
ncbi:unnamed protein product [Phaeothamnion confervicola]